jgi:hypothetical protein
VQEQLLNENIVALRGPYLLPWDAVSLLPVLFYLEILPRGAVPLFWKNNVPGEFKNPWKIADSVYWLWYYRRQLRTSEASHDDMQSQNARSLVANLVHFEDLECTDPRDRVYALLAISSDAIELGIAPDYSPDNTIKQLLEKLSMAAMQRFSPPTILSLVCGRDNLSDPNYPSWALNSLRSWLSRSKPISVHTNKASPRSSAKEKARFHKAKGKSVLTLRGQIVDKIAFVTRHYTATPSSMMGVGDEDSLQDLMGYIVSLSVILFRLGVTRKNVVALGRAMRTNPTWAPALNQRNSPEEEIALHMWSYFVFWASHFEQQAKSLGIDASTIVARCDCLARLLSELALNKAPHDSFPDDLLPEDEIRERLGEWDANTVALGRVLCITEKNRLCNGMNKVALGDVVAAFQDSDVLWILRPVGDKYILVGDAYVDGLMLGEAYHGFTLEEVLYDIDLI